jgi:hypothetical protein
MTPRNRERYCFIAPYPLKGDCRAYREKVVSIAFVLLLLTLHVGLRTGQRLRSIAILYDFFVESSCGGGNPATDT